MGSNADALADVEGVVATFLIEVADARLKQPAFNLFRLTLRPMPLEGFPEVVLEIQREDSRRVKSWMLMQGRDPDLEMIALHYAIKHRVEPGATIHLGRVHYLAETNEYSVELAQPAA